MFSMDDVEKEKEDDKMDIQASYSSIIRDFRANLLHWLEKENESGGYNDFEDRDLDALLLKVSRQSLS